MTDIRRPLISTNSPKQTIESEKINPFFFQRMMIASEKPSRLHNVFPVPWFVWRNRRRWKRRPGLPTSPMRRKFADRDLDFRESDVKEWKRRREVPGTVTVVAVGVRRVVSWWWLVAGFVWGCFFLVGRELLQEKWCTWFEHKKVPFFDFWSKVDGN